jgi:hypothetical protein
MLDYVSMTIFEALQKTVPRIRGEHLKEQTEAHIAELLRGVDWLWDQTIEDTVKPQPEIEMGGSEDKEERPPFEDEWDPEHGEDWKGGPP